MKEIAKDEKGRREKDGLNAEDLRWQKDAILALRERSPAVRSDLESQSRSGEAAEMHLIRTLEGANLCAIHRKRITVEPKVGPPRI